MTINNKTNNINLTDLLKSGDIMGIKKKKCENIIAEVDAAVNNFETFAENEKIREKTYSTIQGVLEQNKINI
ncbi:hypothetical protein [Clostridium sp. OM05-9]|nr:hypothetical protein [Clostridium sp. OM05-9]